MSRPKVGNPGMTLSQTLDQISRPKGTSDDAFPVQERVVNKEYQTKSAQAPITTVEELNVTSDFSASIRNREVSVRTEATEGRI